MLQLAQALNSTSRHVSHHRHPDLIALIKENPYYQREGDFLSGRVSISRTTVIERTWQRTAGIPRKGAETAVVAGSVNFLMQRKRNARMAEFVVALAHAKPDHLTLRIRRVWISLYAVSLRWIYEQTRNIRSIARDTAAIHYESLSRVDAS